METNQNGTKRNKGILNVIFSRTTVLVILLLIQIAMFVLLFLLLSTRFVKAYVALLFLGFAVIVYIMNKPELPEFKIAWILPILGVPVFGTLLYIYMKIEGRSRKLGLRLSRTHMEVAPYMQQDPETLEALRRSNPAEANLVWYLNHRLGYPVHQKTEVRYCPSGESSFDALREALLSAKEFIFMEFFIVSEGYVLETVLSILKQKVEEGVEVRFLYDGTNAITQLPWKYPKYLCSLGIQAKMFSPPRPVLATYQNNRDHRKVVVVDGKIGFTGGINLADEYVNRIDRFGHWKDAGILLRGEAVQNLTMMFLEMWNVDAPGPENYEKYLTPPDHLPEGSGYVVPFADSPFDHEEVGESVYRHMLTHAKKYVHIMTPYLVLDNNMVTHMTYAAKCGIDVSIIMPHVPDKWAAFALAKTYYRELIEAGVQIYEYLPGFVHAKVFVSDDEAAVVGTINCDYRSLYLHFEDAGYFYRNTAVSEVEADFQDTLKKCRKVTLLDCSQRPLRMKLAGQILRIFAPLM